MAGTVWPILTAGLKAKASEVESKFDWIEGTIVPMSAGAKTDAAYDLGEAANRWNNIYGVTLYGQVNAKSAFMAYKNSNQTITSATMTLITVDAEHVDYLDEFTTTGNYFKPVLGGLYLVSAKGNLIFTSTSYVADYQVVVQKNGASTEIFDYRNVVSSISANGITFAMSMLMLLSTSAQYTLAIKPNPLTPPTTAVTLVVQTANTQFSAIKLSNNP